MNQPTDPIAMAAELRRKAERLIGAAETIEETYGIASKPRPRTAIIEAKRPDVSSNGQAVAPKRGKRGPKKKNRRNELIDFMKSSGALRRNEIHVGTKIPFGTLGMLLKDGPFAKTDDGKWIYDPSANQE
jgi:hypothetical protein